MKYPKPSSVPADTRAKRRAKDAHWQQVRKLVLARDGRRCRVCHTRDGVDVHHIRFRSAGREDSSANCATLCRICHTDVHGYRLTISGNADGKLKVERTA